MSLLTLLNGESGWGTYGSDLPDLYLEWSPTTGPRDTPIWERIPLSDIRSIDVNRGRNRELDRFQAGRMSVVLDNRLRRYDPQLGAQAQYVDLPGTSGNNITTPDSSAHPSGDMDIRVRVALDDWTATGSDGAGTGQTLISKWNPTGSQRAWLFRTDSGALGRLNLLTSSAGSATTVNATSTTSVPFSDGTTGWVRVTIDVDNGAAGNTVRFFVSSDTTINPDEVAWTELGTVITAGTTSIFDSSDSIRIGMIADNSNRMAGNVYYAEVRNGIDGPPVAKFDPNTVPQQATRVPSHWTSETGEVWTVNGSAWAWGGTWGTPHSGNVKPMKRIRLRAVWDTTYDLFSGFVDSWDQNYDHTNEATCVVTATDGFKVLNGKRLPESVWEAWIRDEGGYRAWYRLGEPSDATVAVDSGPNGFDGTYVGNSQQVGSVPVKEPDPARKFDGDDDYVSLPTSAIPTGTTWTVECWMTSQPFAGLLLQKVAVSMGRYPSPAVYMNVGVYAADHSSTPGRVVADVNGTILIGTSNTFDHDRVHVAVVRDGDAIRLYFDGVLVDSDTLSTTTAMAGTGECFIARNIDPTNRLNFPGTVDEVVIWDSALTADQILAHHDAGNSPLSGDSPSDRIGQLLDWINWASADRNIDTGESTLQSASLGGTALTQLQAVEETEEGYLFITGDGKIRFVSRHNTLNQTADVTFGDGGGSEIPYTDITFDYSDQPIRNEIRVTRDGGVQQIARDEDSIESYAQRTFDRSALLNASDTDSLLHAEFLLALSKDPALRVESITVEPQDDPTDMMPVVLGMEIGDWVTVIRRPQGIGDAIEQTLIAQGVSHMLTPKRWTTRLYLSPVGTTAFWLLGTSGYSELGETTRLGW